MPEPSNSTRTYTPLLTKLWQNWGENLKILIAAVILALVIRTFVAEPRFIPSASMLPTLELGDRLVVEKISYKLHPPTYADIVVFAVPPQLQAEGYQADQAFIKRAIGLPGDRISVKNGRVYRNDVALVEPYVTVTPKPEDISSITIPANEIFVMGDNRNNSNDSRYWGTLPMQNLIGKAVWRFFPLTRWGKL
jgi:signal peptidase I